MNNRDLLTENEVIQGAINFLSQKGISSSKRVLSKADAEKKEHGVDLKFTLESQAKNGNKYIIEAKGNKNTNGTVMSSTYDTNFRWVLSQIILRIKVDPTKYNYIYGIAMPKSDVENCIRLMRNNWALKHLKIRLYGAYFDTEGQLTAKEYLPKEIYD